MHIKCLVALGTRAKRVCLSGVCKTCECAAAANDDARAALLAAVAAFVPRLAAGDAAGLAPVLGVLGAGIKDAKEVPRRQALRTAAQVRLCLPT